MAPEFKGWPKISRLANEQMVITEKIDGSNACVAFLPNPDAPFGFDYSFQSRSRIITPESDNFGFARWGMEWLDELYADLGFGYHYGEWWGSGIQRGYGLEKGEKRFSLFNAPRWNQAFDEGHSFTAANLGVVPLLFSGPLDQANIHSVVSDLYEFGSYVDTPVRFKNPEGVVVYLREAKASYKVTDAVVGQKERYASE